MSDALAAVHPATTRQTCLVPRLRHSVDYANWRERKPLGAALRAVYTAPTAEAAAAALEAFGAGLWSVRFPRVVASWRRAWPAVLPFFAFPPAIRRVRYTTNALEPLNALLRTILKTRGHFPSDEAAITLIWLTVRNVSTKWKPADPTWKSAMVQFALLHEDRFSAPGA